MIRAATAHAFDKTGATTVQLMVFSVNERARHCYESVGFKERRTETGAFSYHDEVCNVVI